MIPSAFFFFGSAEAARSPKEGYFATNFIRRTMREASHGKNRLS